MWVSIWVSDQDRVSMIKKSISILGSQKEMVKGMANYVPQCCQSQTVVSKWKHGISKPQIEDLIGIQLATKGKVKVGDFIPGLKYSKPKDNQVCCTGSKTPSRADHSVR